MYQYVLRFTPAYIIFFQRAFVVVSAFFHFRDQLPVSVKEGPEFSAPPNNLRVIAGACCLSG
jgi:hypothetical protein